VGDAVRNTAGVTQLGNSAASYDNLSIRGIALENRSSYRLNGSLPLISLIAIPTEDKERVEVLKGASSLYYGLVPPAGIISFETKRAGPKPVTSVDFVANQYGGYDAHLDVGRRFGENDRFGLRVNLLDGKDNPGLKPYHGHRDLKSAAFDFRLADNLTFRGDLEQYQKKSTEQAPLRVSPFATTVPRAPDARTNLGADWAVLDARATNALARIDWGITENWNLTAEYGIVHASRSRSLPNVYLVGAATAGAGSGNLPSYTTGDAVTSTNFLKNQRYNNKNQRLDLSGRLETGPFAHEITLGYTRNIRFQYGGDNYGTQGSTSSLVTIPGSGGGTNAQNIYNPVPLPLGSLSTTPIVGTGAQIEDLGVYAVDRIIFSKNWQLLVGLRHESYRSYNTSQPSGAIPPAYTTTANSPNVSVIYKFTPNNSVYASRLVGLDVGQTVVQDYINGGSLLPAVKTKQTEVGYKHQLGGVLLQGAYFNIDKATSLASATPYCGATSIAAKNALLAADSTKTLVVPQQYGPNLWCVSTLSNDGSVRYRGLEFAASGDINRNLGVVASAMFLNAKDSFNLVPGNTPKQTFSLFGEYRPDALPGLGVNAALYFTGRRPVFNNDNAYLPATTIYSLGSRYRTQLGATAATFQVSVDNLFNKNYWAAGDSVNAIPSIATGLPRIIRMTAKFDF
jgi:iron complex outermembrane receptor protein